MAEKRRTRGSLSNLLGEVADDTKGLVDDALDRAGDLEQDLRRALGRAVSGSDRNDARPASASELESLRSALDDLTAKVERLAALQEDAARKSSS